MEEAAMTLRVHVYVCNDPDCPPEARAIAHWFRADKLEVAIATAADPKAAHQKLSEGLAAELAHYGRRDADKRNRTPEQIAAAQVRTANARAAKAAKVRAARGTNTTSSARR
jgi:hypothetical protein